MKKYILLLTLSLVASWVSAQAPKWVEKAKRAVFSVVTYDRNDKILNTGNGFFVGEDGVAISDYTLFKGAQRAVVMTADGKQMPVATIMGANDMYDVVKFRVTIDGKKVPALTPAATAPAAGVDAYLLPYSTRKDRSYTSGKVSAADKISGDYFYYTLDMQLKDKMVSCPLMTADGQVFGLAQKSSGKDTATICYAIDVAFAMSQSISALSYNDRSLQNIGIKKSLPDTEEQALVFLFMASTQLTPEKYMVALNDFIDQYPRSADGYMRRATQQLALSTELASVDKAVADMDKALDVVTEQKDDVYYTRSKLIYTYLLNKPEQAYADWTFDKALEEVRHAFEINPLPVYTQLEGDIHFAKQDYAAALASYEQVNKTNLASPVTFYSVARTKQLMEAPAEEVLAAMDSCIARFSQPYMQDAAPYLFERAQARMNANQARLAIQDYDAYFNVMNGNVNDLFYYYREQAAMRAKQYQRALDDMAKAIELNPSDLTYRAELAVVNIRVGRNEQAIEILKEALELDANYAEAYRLMGLAYIQLKNKKEARTALEKAKELGDPSAEELIKKHCK